MLRLTLKSTKLVPVDCAQNNAELQKLCLSCGLCCNGVLFADVNLQPEDNAKALLKLGIPVQSAGAKEKFNQPCTALSNRVCGIYEQRPAHCRAFECLLYQRVRQGQVRLPEALKKVKMALAAAAHVQQLLNKLGDCDQHLPLRRRFQKQMRRAEGNNLDPEAAELISELSVAMHELTMLLREHFYE